MRHALKVLWSGGLMVGAMTAAAYPAPRPNMAEVCTWLSSAVETHRAGATRGTQHATYDRIALFILLNHQHLNCAVDNGQEIQKLAAWLDWEVPVK